MARPAGPSSAPPPPDRPPLGKDTFSKWLTGSVEAEGRGSVAESAIVSKALQELGGSAQLRQLQEKSGLHFRDFSSALEELRISGDIDIMGNPGRESVRLLRRTL
jgi:hypothetical protein